MAFTHVRVVLHHSDATIALDTVVDFPASATAVTLSLSVDLLASAPASGEAMTLDLAYVNAAGDTVFRGGPVSITATPQAAGQPGPPAVDVPVSYTGPGANATAVKITPVSLTVTAGDPFVFTAVAVDGTGATVANAPIIWTSLDPTLASVPSSLVGAGTTTASRGTAHITAQLLTGPSTTAILTILPKASAIAAVSGSGQSGAGSTILAQPVVVKVAATDGLPMSGVAVSFSASNGGSVGVPTATTNDNGLAQTAWQLGPNAGSQALLATATGLTGSPVTFSATATSGAATKLVVSTQPTDAVAGSPLQLSVTAQDANGNTATAFAGPVGVAIGANPKGGVLAGTVVANAVAGVATFPSLSINKVGTGYTLVASSAGVTPVTTAAFNISAGPASALVLVSGGAQTGPASAALPLPIVIAVTDASGNPIAGRAVTLAVGVGGGSVTPTSGTSDASGQFSAVWTLGTAVGAQTLNASGVGLLPNPLTITATAATAGIPGVTAGFLFTQGPSNTVAGASISPAITVAAKDAFGTPVTNFTGSVTLAIGTNAGGATLSGTVTVPAVAGVATFNNISLNRIGTAYTLTATTGALAPSVSSTFNITAGAAATMTIAGGSNQTGAINAPLPSPLAVLVTDALGNPVSGVVLTWAVVSGGGSLPATSTTNAAGVATVIWTLGPTVGPQSAAVSGVGGVALTFAATGSIAGVVSSLAITTQPTSAGAGVAIAPAIVVQARDGAGALVSTYTGNITLAIGTNPGNSTLSGTLTVAAVGGVATFNNISLNHSGTGYTLIASAAAVSNATSTPFNITTGAATHLAFIVQPAASGPGVILSPAVTVAAQDALNNTVTSFVGNVTVAIGTNPGGATLTGTATVAAVAGVATFSNLALTTVGAGYTLTAATAGLTAATSTPFSLASATLTWTNPSGGSWSVPTNWSLGRVPVTSDSVVIALAGTYTVTLDTTFTATSITVGLAGGTQTLALNSRTLTVNGTFTVKPGGAFVASASTIVGAGAVVNQGTITATNTNVIIPVANQATAVFAGNSGVAGAFTNNAGATLQVQGNGSVGTSTLVIASGFTNSGAIELTDITSSYGAVLAVGTGTLVNSSIGTISALVGSGGPRTLTAQLDNQGVVNATGGASFTLLQPSGVHTNSGTINVTGTSFAVTQAGTAPSFTTTGTITIGSGLTFTVTGGTFTHSAGPVNGAGAFVANSVTMTLNTGFTPASFSLTGSNLTLNAALSTAATASTISGSNIGGPGSITNAALQTLNLNGNTVVNTPVSNSGTLVAGGTVTIGNTLTNAAGATLRVLGNGSVGTSTLTVTTPFTNNGAIELTDITSSYGAVLNVPNGTLTNASTGTIGALVGSNGPRTLNAQLNNQGIVNATGGASFTLALPSAAQTNSGTINVTGTSFTVAQSGTAPSLATTGTIAIGAGQTFTVTGGTFTHSAGAINGAGAFAASSATVTLNAGFAPAIFTLTGSNLTLNTPLSTASMALTISSSNVGGTGSITNAALQTLNLNGNTSLNTTVSNNGTLVAGGTITLGNTFTNGAGATLQVQGNGAVGTSTLTINTPFTNNGAIQLTDVTSSYGAVLNVPNGTLTNASTGTISALTGSNGPRTLNAQLDNQGTVNAAGGASFTLALPSAAQANSGTISVSGTSFTVNQSGTSPSFSTTGTINVGLGLTFAVNNGTFTQAAGTMSGNGTLSLGAVTATINAGVTLSFLTATNTTLALNAALVTSTTMLNLTGVTVNGSGSITNASGQTMVLVNTTINPPITNSGQILYGGTGGFTGTYAQTSTGTLELAGTGATGIADLTIANGFTNNGIIDMSSTVSSYPATLTVTNGTLTNASLGTISTSFGAGGARTITAQISNLGTISIGVPLTLNRPSTAYTSSGVINVSAADLTVTQSGTSPSFTNTGTIFILSTRTMAVSGGTFTDQSGATLSGAGTLALNAGVAATLNNAIAVQTLNVSNAAVTFGVPQSTSSGTAFNFNNATVNGPGFTNASGQTLTLIGSTINEPVTNQGTLIASAASAINGALTTAGGSTLRIGQVDGSVSQATLTVANSFTNNGTLELTTIINTAYNAQLIVSSGTLTNAAAASIISTDGGAGGGTRVITATVNNLGTIAVQSGGITTGRLSIVGSLTTSGALTLKLAGTAVATQYDQIAVTGAATLGGTLNVSLAGGFVPASTNNFVILTSSGARTGTFATNNLPASITTPPTYGLNSVTLVAP